MRQAIERGGLPLTATGNLSRAVVAEMRKLIEWPGYDQDNAFRLHKVINEPDFLPLHVVRLLAETAKLVRIHTPGPYATFRAYGLLERRSLIQPREAAAQQRAATIAFNWP
jgi:hypothetical protein